MNKTAKLLIGVSAALILLGSFFTGLTLTRRANVPEKTTATGVLIGVFLTREPLDAFGGERLWAAEEVDENDSRRWNFDEEGVLFIVPAWGEGETRVVGCQATDEVSEIRQNVSDTDEGRSYAVDGTVHVLPEGMGTWYVNPVYQLENAGVYAVPGDGVWIADVETSFKTDETQTTEEGGKETTRAFSVSVTFRPVSGVRRIDITQFDADHKVLAAVHAAPDTVPPVLALNEMCSYFLVETTDPEGKVTRELHTDEEEIFTVLIPTDRGVCVSKMVEVERERD